MLKKIDQADVDKLDDAQRQHLMVNAEGEYVFAQADEKAWKKHLDQVKAAEAAQQKVQLGNKELQERGLECSIDKRLFVDPMKTPCCGKTYCHDCIENALIDSDLTCPGCGTENISLERLEPDEDMKAKIKDYEDGKSNEKQRSQSPAASVNTPNAHASETAVSRNGSKSPGSVDEQTKKRTADEANEKSPESLAAPAMKRQKSGEASSAATPQPDNDASESASNMDTNNFPFMPPDMSQNNMPFPMMNMMNGMNGMPFMPMMNPGMMNMNMMNMPIMPGMMPNMPMNQPNQNFNQNFNQGNNWHQNKNHQFRGKRPFQNQHQQQNQAPKAPTQPAGMTGVPTGPKALQQGVPTGPANKFANQQRYVGKEEDNAYMRQPVNPGRQWGRNKGGNKAREADYKEL
jgi:protein MPE1